MADLVVGVVRDCRERRPGLDVGRRQRHGPLLGSARAGGDAGGALRRPADRDIGARPRAEQRPAKPRRVLHRAYQTIEIMSPADQETLWNIGTALPVQVRFQPALLPGHRYDVLLDGQRRNVNTVSPRVTLAGRLPRHAYACRSSSSMRRARRSCARRREPSSFSKRAHRIQTREPAAATSRR